MLIPLFKQRRPRRLTPLTLLLIAIVILSLPFLLSHRTPRLNSDSNPVPRVTVPRATDPKAADSGEQSDVTQTSLTVGRTLSSEPQAAPTAISKDRPLANELPQDSQLLIDAWEAKVSKRRDVSQIPPAMPADLQEKVATLPEAAQYAIYLATMLGEAREPKLQAAPAVRLKD